MSQEEETLRQHGIRITNVRLNVWTAIKSVSETFSLADVLDKLPDMDESTVYRNLRKFMEAKLIHEVNDGTDTCKYCICHCPDEEHLQHHFHFHCNVCGRTFCLDDVPAPTIPLLNNYQIEDAEYILKGKCPNCINKL